MEALILAIVMAIAVGAAAWSGIVRSFGNWITETAGLGLDLVALVGFLAAAGFALLAHRHVTAERVVRRELLRLSVHDSLTDLPNRRLLGAWVAHDIEWSQGRGAQAGVLFIDLDRFKHINDAHGHETGDLMMRAVADRLRATCRPGDRVVRFGGDEFVMICPGLTGVAAAERIAHGIVQTIEQPFAVAGQTMRISACVGAALAEHRTVDPNDVIRDADVAMYQAKALGSGHVVLFDRSMAGALTPATAAKLIRAALDAGEFHLHYQPVVDLGSGRIVGAEALLRWISPEQGTMAPDEFVPILEETGLIVPVGTWVIQEACREAARLNDLLGDAPPLAITVNVSARQLTQDGFADIVASAMHHAGVADGQIHLEITEGALMDDVASAWAVLRQAKALGVKLALDDFGTGYSSLSYVRRFSLDMLKIDKSFIDGLETSREDRAIVEHVIGMANALGMVTVAEGVERPEQLAWLRRLGCGLAQGFALSRPLAAGDLEALLLRRLRDPYPIGQVTPHPVELVIPDPEALAAGVPWLDPAPLDRPQVDSDRLTTPPLVFEDPDHPSAPHGPVVAHEHDHPAAATGVLAAAAHPGNLPRFHEYLGESTTLGTPDTPSASSDH